MKAVSSNRKTSKTQEGADDQVQDDEDGNNYDDTDVLVDKDDVINVSFFEIVHGKKHQENGYYLIPDEQKNTDTKKQKNMAFGEVMSLMDRYRDNPDKQSNVICPDLLYITYSAPYIHSQRKGAKVDVGSWMDLVADERYEHIKGFLQDNELREEVAGRSQLHNYAIEGLGEIFEGDEHKLKLRAVKLKQELVQRGFHQNFCPDEKKLLKTL